MGSRRRGASRTAWLVGAVMVLVMGGGSAQTDASRYFVVEVVDEQTGRGVPLVELKTVNEVRYLTDSNGLAAIDEPGLAGQTVWFHVRSHGYEVPADGFGHRGVALEVRPGGSAKVPIRRLNVAERLYRVTGEGIYRDSVLVGRPVPTKKPVLNAQVLGSDSVHNAVYRGRLFWLWGDTNRVSYPLGNFHTPAATSRLPGDGGLDPSVGVDLEYYTAESGFAKETARLSGPTPGPTWLGALVVLPEGGEERLFGAYSKVNSAMVPQEQGLVRFNDQEQRFEKVVEFPLHAPVLPHGHPFQHEEDGKRYVYFGDPYPLVRVPAAAEALRDLSQYQAYTCLKEGSRLDRDRPPSADLLDRDAEGRLRYAWRSNTPVVGPFEQDRLMKAGLVKPEEALLHLQDVDTGQTVLAHRGSVCWNDFRKRWVMIAGQHGGTSLLGEIWYAEADTPLGPWVYARKVVTHDRYSFYNPTQHPYFAQQGGRLIYFEGTYTHSFSGNPEQTPRYDYNQIMYRLDLADPRLVLPVPVTASTEANRPYRTGMPESGTEHVPFFAFDRPRPGSVPVTWSDGRLTAGGGGAPLFHALPADTEDPPATTVPLYEWTHPESGARRYTAGDGSPGEGYARSEQPICRVWRAPGLSALPKR